MGIITAYPDDSATTDSDKFLTSDSTGATKLTAASTMKDYILADGNVTTAKLAASSVTSSKLASGSVTNASLATGTGEPGGAWTSFTPTWTNATVGNGTLVAKYKQVGKTVNFRIRFTLGSTSTIGTNPQMSLPVIASSEYTVNDSIHSTIYYNDATGNRIIGLNLLGTTSRLDLYFLSATPAYFSISSTNPFTWTTNDAIIISGTYEAA